MNINEAHLAIVEHYSKPGAQLSWKTQMRINGDHRDVCQYRYGRDPNSDRRCGIGVLIPNSLYDPQWDSFETNFTCTIHGLLINVPEVREFFSEIPMQYLIDVQASHDSCTKISRSQSEEAGVAQFLEDLDKIAEQWNIQLVPDFLEPEISAERDLVLST